MGQQGSKPAVDARVIFQRAGASDACERDERCSPASVVRIQKKVTNLHSSPGALSRTQGRCDTGGGLVYVMDNPTGGVWVKPGEKWTRT